MKLAIGQINPIIGDFRGNTEKILEGTRQAHARGAELVVFPELCVCGYPPMDLLDQKSFVEANLKALRQIQRGMPGDIGIVVGYVDRNPAHTGKSLINNAALMQEGKILLNQAKSLLPTYDVFDEARYFEPSGERRILPWRGERLGIAICEDFWWEAEPETNIRYPLDPMKELLDLGATLILAPSASPFYTGKPQLRRSLLAGIGKSSGVPVVYVNTVGANDSLIFDGQSMITSRDGKLVFLGRAFREELAFFDTREKAKEIPLPDNPQQQLEQALMLGIRDYLGKCGFERVHLGLSGGIDSALVASLAVRALGPASVRAFALPSRYSSEASLRDAEQLAGNLEIPLTRLAIEEIYGSYLSALEPTFAGRAMDITEENLQARIRGTALMAYANKFASLLLATGNKSELATGYATLYGDMCGALAVIGDLFKTQVYALARSLNQGQALIPESILTKEPTAELRLNQRDRDTLPPYEVLDRILELYLLRNLNLEEIVERGFDSGLVSRVLTMVARAEYKRRQAPPVLKVSPRAFGTGRRIPIARTIYELDG